MQCRQTILWTIRACAMGVVVLLVMAAGARAQPAPCQVKHEPFVEGGVAQGHMQLVNDGASCEFTFKFRGTLDPSEWKVEAAPGHGTIEASGSVLRYTPVAGYSGPDAFTVAIFGRDPFAAHGRKSRDGRFAFTVDVRAAGSKP